MHVREMWVAFDRFALIVMDFYVIVYAFIFFGICFDEISWI